MVLRLTLAMAFCAACSLEPVAFDDKRCPCDEGWHCDPDTMTCTSTPPELDAGPDADRSLPDLDAGARDAEADAGDSALSSQDAGWDGGPPDAGADSGPPDAGTPDAGPTTTPVEDLTDTYVDSTMPDTSFGSAEFIVVDGEPAIYQTLIAPADLGGLSPGTVIVSATLELTCFNEGDEAQVYLITEPWTDAVTWNTRPAFESSSFTSFTAATVGRVSIDLTTAVQAWVDGADNHGVLIRSLGTDGTDYHSTEHAVAAERPVLIIEHH